MNTLTQEDLENMAVEMADKIRRRDITARRVSLDSQGYDSSGAYWGNDMPLYWIAFVAPNGNEISEFMRFPNRRAAVDYAMSLAAKQN